MSAKTRRADREFAKQLRAEAWESFWQAIVSFIVCPIATVKFVRSKVREGLR